jgi:hypothetical protein
MDGYVRYTYRVLGDYGEDLIGVQAPKTDNLLQGETAK